MTGHYGQVAFTPAVQEHQRRHGSLDSYSRRTEGPAEADLIGPDEALFIAERESFYLATVGETGWPYIQHRGGPPGFLRVLDSRTLGFADFRGNRQYISRGNLDHDDRVSLFLMDYAAKARMKIFGRARVVETADDPALVSAVAVQGYPGQVERVMLIEVEAYDWNCRQHIPELYTRETVTRTLTALQDRVGELERENAKLRRPAQG